MSVQFDYQERGHHATIYMMLRMKKVTPGSHCLLLQHLGLYLGELDLTVVEQVNNFPFFSVLFLCIYTVQSAFTYTSTFVLFPLLPPGQRASFGSQYNRLFQKGLL